MWSLNDETEGSVKRRSVGQFEFIGTFLEWGCRRGQARRSMTDCEHRILRLLRFFGIKTLGIWSDRKIKIVVFTKTPRKRAYVSFFWPWKPFLEGPSFVTVDREKVDWRKWMIHKCVPSNLDIGMFPWKIPTSAQTSVIFFTNERFCKMDERSTRLWGMQTSTLRGRSWLKNIQIAVQPKKPPNPLSWRLVMENKYRSWERNGWLWERQIRGQQPKKEGAKQILFSLASETHLLSTETPLLLKINLCKINVKYKKFTTNYTPHFPCPL